MDAGGSAAVSMVGTLAAAAIIGPEAVGLSAIALGIVQIVLHPVAALFADPICQRKRLTRAQLDAAFWVLLALGSAVAGALLASAEFWAGVYREPSLSAMLAAGSLAILLTACSSVQGALLRRHMRFRTLAIMGLASRTAAAAAAVGLALAGFGAWSLLLQFVASQAAFSFACIIASGWRPRLRVPLRSLKGIFGFAVTEMVHQGVGAGRSNLFLAVVALYLPLERVGEIGFALRLTDALRSVIGSAAGRLCVGLFSRQQSAPDRLRALFLNASRIIAALALPGFAALAVCAPELIRTVFGERWLGAVPHLQALAVLSGLLLVRLPAGFILTATARPQIGLVLQLAALSAMLVMFLVLSPASATTAVACWVVPHLFFALDFLILRRIFGVSVSSQLQSLAPGLAMAAVVAGAVIGLRTLLDGAELRPETFLALEVAACALLMGGGLATLLASRTASMRW